MTSFILNVGRLSKFIRPALMLPERNQGRFETGAGVLRVRARSGDRSIYLDATLPIPQSGDDTQQSFWLGFEQLQGYLSTYSDGNVTLTPPIAAPDGRIELDAAGLTYRFAPTNPRYVYKLEPIDSSPTVSSCIIPHEVFARAVEAANLVGDELEVSTNPQRGRIEFSSTTSADRDAFRYRVPDDRIDGLSGTAGTITIAVTILREIVPVIAERTRVRITVKADRLTYRVSHPTEDATLNLHIAHRHESLP